MKKINLDILLSFSFIFKRFNRVWGCLIPSLLIPPDHRYNGTENSADGVNDPGNPKHIPCQPQIEEESRSQKHDDAARLSHDRLPFLSAPIVALIVFLDLVLFLLNSKLHKHTNRNGDTQ